MTAVDNRPTWVADASYTWSAALVVQALDALEYFAKLREQHAYDAGFADGHAAGIVRAEREIAQEWACLARMIRRDAERLRRPVTDPAERPQRDDSMWFTADDWAAWAGAS